MTLEEFKKNHPDVANAYKPRFWQEQKTTPERTHRQQ